MRKDLNILAGDIVLIPKSKQNGFCQLGQYIQLLKYLQVRPPYQFSYLGQDSTLINNLTIKENIEMVIHNSLERKNPLAQLRRQLSEQKREKLTLLLEKIEMIELLPTKVTPAQRKLAGIIKALIRPSKYLFFENIEEHLNGPEIKLVTDAILEHRSIFNCTIFLKSENSELWFKQATKLLTRNKDLSYSFSTIVKDNVTFVDFKNVTENEDTSTQQDKLSA